MSFTDAIRTCLSKYVDFSGRAARSEYWWWVLFVVLGSFVFGFIDGAIFGAAPDGRPISILGGLWSLALLLPSIAVGVRRLHDRDMVGWWLLLAFIPIVGSLILIFFFVQRGTDGTNRFGPDPLAGVARV